MKLLAISVWLTTFVVGGLAADESLSWPRFRGPNGSGVADGQKPPVELGPEKNVKWKVPVPPGLSSPIIAGDKVVITALEDGKLYTIAYSAADGKEAWRAQAAAKQLEPYHQTEGSPAASTSATDGERIVSYFGSCGLVCLDLAGKELWKLGMPPAAIAGEFGSGVSPILVDGIVVLVRDERTEPKILALDARTGAVKWQKKRQSMTSYCTPIVWDTPAGKQVAAAGHARMIGYDLKTGAEEWFVAGVPSTCTPSPVIDGDKLFFAGWAPSVDDKDFQMPTFDSMLKQGDANGDGVLSREEAQKTDLKNFFDNNDANKDGKITRDEWDTMMKFMFEGKNTVFALKSGGKGDLSSSHVLWKKTKGTPHIPSALVYRGQYVLVKDGGIVTVYDTRTGAEIYQERAVAAGRYYASPVAANGNIYFTALDDGTVTVLKAGTDKPEVVAKNPKLGERAAATPAISGNVLFVRTDKHIYAFADRK